MIPYGCRKVKVFNNVTSAEIDLHGAYGYLEVENIGTTAIEFNVNEFIHQGHKGTAIPIKAGATRQIPLKVYRFEATGPVNVIAYGL